MLVLDVYFAMSLDFGKALPRLDQGLTSLVRNFLSALHRRKSNNPTPLPPIDFQPSTVYDASEVVLTRCG